MLEMLYTKLPFAKGKIPKLRIKIHYIYISIKE